MINTVKISEPNQDQEMLASLASRYLAQVIDGLLLIIFAFAVTYPVHEKLYIFGEKAIWIGTLIYFLYSVILHSHIGHGQTLGKKILKIQAVDLNGKCLSLWKSALRSLPFIWIFFGAKILMVLGYDITSSDSAYMLVWAFLYFIVFFAIIILAKAHPLRRGLQDYLAGSLVIRKKHFAPLQIAPNANKIVYKDFLKYITNIIFSSILLMGYFHFIGKRSPELTYLYIPVAQDTHFQEVHISLLIQHVPDLYTQKNLSFSGLLPNALFEDETLCAQEITKATKIMTSQDDTLKEVGKIYVTVRTRVDFGIVTYSKRKIYQSNSQGLVFLLRSKKEFYY